MDSLFVILDSHAPDDRTENTTASFTNFLTPPLDLDDAYEVGLKEIQYPYSWYNISKTQYAIIYTHPTTTHTVSISAPFKVLSPGRYCYVETILEILGNGV